MSSHTNAAFYFDFASPESWIIAERILQTMPLATEWIPIQSSQMRETSRKQIEDLAARYQLQKVIWPEHVPFASSLALRAATYAKEIGRTVSFSLAAFRQAYAGGHDLAAQETVLIAAAACEIHPNALITSLKQKRIVQQLQQHTTQAQQLGVLSTPTIQVKDTLFTGVDGLNDAAVYAQSVLADT